MSKSRFWLFSLDAPNEVHIAWGPNVRYAVWQLEQTDGGKRLRGYFEFHKTHAESACRKLVPFGMFTLCKYGSTDVMVRNWMSETVKRVGGPWTFGSPLHGGVAHIARSPNDGVSTDAVSNTELLQAVRCMMKDHEELKAQLESVTQQLADERSRCNTMQIKITYDPK